MLNTGTNTRKPRTAKNLDYVGGLTLANMKKVADFWFGASFRSANRNYKEFTFDVIVDPNTENWQIKKFQEFFRVNVLVAEKRD